MTRPVANKALGQHYLTSKSVISKICEDFQSSAKNIIEVGPGPAVLTKHLAKNSLPLLVIEMDQRFKEHLEKVVPENMIIMGDALEQNLEEIIKEKNLQEELWLVSNLPYNASVPLMMSFIKTPTIKYMTLMFQKEVGEKLINLNSKNQMNSLMAITNNYFSTSLNCKVPPGAFAPPPQVDSVVISFERIEKPTVPLEEFPKYEKFLRNLFQFKRKQIGKVLKSSYSNVLEVLEELDILRSVRAETLSQKQVIDLYRSLR